MPPDDNDDLLASLGFNDAPLAKPGQTIIPPDPKGEIENETANLGRSAADMLGLPDAMRALRGQMTPEEAQHFALVAGMGLLPGARTENLLTGAAKMAGKAVPEMPEILAGLKSAVANSPHAGSDAVMEALKDPGNWNAHSFDPNYNALGSAPIEQSDIDAALAKNPGASIFDVAGTHVGGPSSGYAPKNNGGSQLFDQSLFHDIPREATPFTPLAASIMGKSENLTHGTRVPLSVWNTPSGGSAGTDADALKLPDDELGVHFGNPKQAANFTSNYLDDYAAPRIYPVVVATNNPLRLPDSGAWYMRNILDSLRKANNGQYDPTTAGQFPPDELTKLDSIGDVRSYLQSKGYDSVVYKNKSEDPEHDSYIKFTPSPAAPDFVSGVRSPFAKFDPTKLSWPELAAGIGGAGATGLMFDENGQPLVQTK